MIRIVFSSVLFFYFSFSSAAPAAAPQIEEILIQKAVQELKLEGPHQARFSAEMKRLGEAKRRLRHDMTSALQKMEESDETNLRAYTDALERYNRFRMEEFNTLRGVLGDVKMREYLVFKHKIYSRFKELLAAREKNEF